MSDWKGETPSNTISSNGNRPLNKLAVAVC